MSFARLFESISGRNDPDQFDLSNVERGPRSNFWDHSQHFRTNGFCVIAPNMANFRVKCCFRDDIFTLSCPHLKTPTFDLSNVERGPRSNFWDHSQHFRTNGFHVIAPNMANFWVKCCFRDEIFTLSCPHLKTLTFDFSNVERGQRSNFWEHLPHFWSNGFCIIEPNKPTFW